MTEPGSGLTASLGAFAASFKDIPDEALGVATQGITDAVGTLLAGRTDPAVAKLMRVLLPEGGTPAGESQLLFGPLRARALDACFINAAATHALAMDDVAAGCHPSALLMPALLAEAQALGASGLALLQAYVIGYEVLAELSSRETDALHSAGWHPSCVLGPPAVAAAVARLRGLDAQQCTAAIAAAASMTGGLVANFGTQTKAIQVARASSAGVLAARLAAEGLTASGDAIERSPGLLMAISPQRRPRLEGGFDPSAQGLRIVSQRLSIKKYPVCYSTHRVVDAAALLAAQEGFDAAQVASVTVEIGATQAWMARHHQVRSAFEAKYSVEFAAAAGLIARDASFAQLEPGFYLSPLAQHLIAVTQLQLCADKSEEDPVFSPADRVRAITRDGRAWDSGPLPFAVGHARVPLPAAALKRKFLDCSRAGGFGPAQALLDQLENLRELGHVGQLCSDAADAPGRLAGAAGMPA